jgi:hypothetical protein
LRKLTLILTAALALTLPVSARVLSYAPYTSTPAQAGIHSRSSRHFVLIEGGDMYKRQVVLYDTQGDEPRVVYPPPGSSRPGDSIDYAALYEREGEPPLILVGLTYSFAKLSSDGGLTWKNIGLQGADVSESGWVDNGGAHTQPLWYPVQTGNDTYPFIVKEPDGGGIWAVDAQGVLKQLSAAGTMVGRDREGTRFLVKESGAVFMIDVYGNRRRLFAAEPDLPYAGWITPAGQAYIEMYASDGHYLFNYRNGGLYFVAGPRDQRPPAPGDGPRGCTDELRFFAVPTADYRGAWMIQRRSGQPTTLLRHMPGGDVETMWSDPTGREVEALIPGRSGETLLIQVHVPRDVSVERPFIDPALAVWHVGQPMPTSYDELFLNEEANKSFLHVDVDAMASGEAFVFNSGSRFEANIQEGPVSPPVGGGGEVLQEWGVVRASLKQRLVLPGVTRTRGAYGALWSTDLTIYNPLDVPQSVQVRYAGLGEEEVRSLLRRTQTIKLAPGEIAVIPDALYSLFLIVNGGGTLHFEPEVGVNVFARTYHTTAAGGTYGYGMQAIDFFNAAGPRFTMTFSGAFPGPNFRTNVALTDTSGRGTAATLTSIMSNEAQRIDLASLATPPNSALQMNGIERLRPFITTRGGALVVQPTRGTAIPTVVAIDNITNDPTYFPPDLPATIARSIPVLAHVDTPTLKLRSDLYLYNPTADYRQVILEAKPWDKSVRRVIRVRVGPHESQVIVDALPTLFTFSGYMRVRYLSDEDEATGEGVRVTSRLYTVDANGGTAGALVPPLNNFQIASPGDTLEILGISGGDRFRTNLGLVELSQTNTFGRANLRVRIFDEQHRQLDTFDTFIDSTYGQQLDDLFAARHIETPKAALIQVEVLGGGLVAAYATLIDGVTGDATYLAANLGAKRE